MASMDTIRTTIRNAIADDTATKAWCQTNYSQDHKVYVGIDLRSPPAESDYPIVHLFPVSKTAGYAPVQSDHVWGVNCGIYNATALTVAGKANITGYQGIDHIEDFRKLVETAAVGASLSGLRCDRMEVTYETVEEFPFFFAIMVFYWVHDYSQGDDPFA